ncbi:atos homolog protein B [Aplochiton taeniatus]
MRHIHIELGRKETPPMELQSQEGELPPPAAPTQSLEPGLRPAVPRPFGQEQLRLQKVYQLSIFSQLGGFSASSDAPAQAPPPSRALRTGVKRGLEEPAAASKRPHLGECPEEEEEEEGVLCGPGVSPGGVGPVYHLMELRDSEAGLSPRTPPLSPNHTPSRRPAQHNHDRPLPDILCPLSPKSPPMVPCEAQGPPRDQGLSSGPVPRMEPRPGTHSTGPSLGSAGGESRHPFPPSHPFSPPHSSSTPPHPFSPPHPSSTPPHPSSSPPHPFSPPHPCEFLEPGEASEWAAGLESSPPERSATQPPGVSPCPSGGLPSWEKTPSNGSLRPGPSGAACSAKKKLLSPSDTGESCSEDEGPSTSKRSRLALGTLGTPLRRASCRGTDSKAAPFWTHLLPAVHTPPKSADCSRSGRRLKTGLRLKSRQLRSGRRTDTGRSSPTSWPSASISRSLLGNFEESILKGRFSPAGTIDGFTAEIGASGSYCPQHATLPVHVTYYDISEHSAPSPFMGVVSLEPLGKKGYSVPKAGTIQVTLFNPNKTVVKMFLVTYSFGDMPVNHMTFLRHRIFLVPVEEGLESQGEGPPGGVATDRKKILCYLIHLRFHSSKSGKIYLHNDIRLLFSRKSIEVDNGIPYELKSFTEVPRNPKYSPRV